jgi:glycosyltransferase involved in cell wall biosynthesis
MTGLLIDLIIPYNTGHMAHKKLPVIAAIPNYNMAKGLKRLLPQVLDQGYDHVYVLDDASTDESEAIVTSFKSSKITFVKSERNGGGGAARNNLIPFLKSKSLIHFIDADVSIVSKNTAKIIQDLDIDDHTAFIAGLVLDKDGFPSVWNYGPTPSVFASIGSHFTYLTRKAENRYNINLSLIYDVMRWGQNPHRAPMEKSIFWPLETSCVIRSDTFLKLGGFDASIRENDIQPLAMKAHKLQLKSYFIPTFVVKDHDDINVRLYNRSEEMRQSGWYTVRKYWGLTRWWLPFLKK